MRKFFTILSLFAALMIPTLMNAEVVFDFDAMEHASSSNDSNDGDITAAEGESFTAGGVTVTVSPAAEGVRNANRFWGTSPRLRCYSGTITVTADMNIQKMTFEGHNSNFNLTPDVGTLTGKVWTAPDTQSVSTVVFTVERNTQISKLTVLFEGETEEVVELPVAENIAAFKALATGTEAKLTLTEAQVNKVHVNGNNTNIYLQDATGGLVLYNTGLELAEGTIVNGTIIGKYSVYNTIPQLVASDKTADSQFQATSTETLATIEAKIGRASCRERV